MASPPFNIAETSPGDDDVASTFPALERTFRDVVESWLLIEHDTYGHHAFQSLTSTERDADTHWSVGSLMYNETLGRPQIATATGPVTWLTLGREFDAGTRSLFQQTSAPTGWTKESAAAYEDAAIAGTTGSVGTAGSTAFSSVFTSRTIAQANLPNVNFTISATAASHTHYGFTNENNGAPTPGINLDSSNQVTASAVGGASDSQYALENSVAAATVGKTSASGSLTVTGTAASGGSGTAMDFAVKYYKVIVAQKD